jgi:TonB family protein
MIADAVSHSRLRSRLDQKLWYRMLICSLVLHVALVIFATAKWGMYRGTTNFAPVYSVELVSLPSAEASAAQDVPASPRVRSVPAPTAIPISRFGSKKQTLSLKKKNRPEMSTIEPEESKLYERSLTKIERRSPPQPAAPVQAQKTARKVRSGRKKVSLVNIGGMSGSELSQALGLYRALVNEKIESNWVFPEQLHRQKGKIEAIVVVRARRDGTVFGIEFEKKSGDPYFDESVLKAIIKSKPFPPFPDIYSPKEEEIVIRFSPPNGRS